MTENERNELKSELEIFLLEPILEFFKNNSELDHIPADQLTGLLEETSEKLIQNLKIRFEFLVSEYQKLHGEIKESDMQKLLSEFGTVVTNLSKAAKVDFSKLI